MAFADPSRNIAELNLREGLRVADLGSGAGHYSFEAAKKVRDDGIVYAVDVQKELLGRLKGEALRQGLFNIEVVWGDFEELGGSKLGNESVDAVILSNILFQIEKKEGLLEEIKRILRSNGKVLVVDWSDSFSGLGPRPEDVFSESEAKKLFLEGGFKIDKDISAGENHYGFIARFNVV